MKKYQVEFNDFDKGYTTPIDTIVVPDGYTAEDYIRDCKDNADEDWNEMLSHGSITLFELSED